VKEVWKSVNIWRSYGQYCSALFFRLTVYIIYYSLMLHPAAVPEQFHFLYLIRSTTIVSFYRQTDRDTHSAASFPGQPRQAGIRKVKPIWILMKQEMIGWQWHQLNHMQLICTFLQTKSHASTLRLYFLQAGCSSWRPTNSVKSTEGNLNFSTDRQI